MNIVLAFNVRRHKVNFQSDQEAEYDSRKTVYILKETIVSLGHKVRLVEADENFAAEIKKIKNKINLVFNATEGKFGEGREAYVPAILDNLNIPYTGSDPLILALALDKGTTKAVLAFYNIPTAPFQIFVHSSEKLNSLIKFPCFVKPNNEGSSRGIDEKSIVKNKRELYRRINFVIKKYRQPALVEEYLPGLEFSVGILGNYPKEKILPIMRLDFKKSKSSRCQIDTFFTKHLQRLPKSFIECPAKISLKLQKKINHLALKIYRLLRCKDLARIDFRLDKKGTPNFLEVNPLPAISYDDLCGFPRAAKIAGLNYQKMIAKIIDLACQRYHLPCTIKSHGYKAAVGYILKAPKGAPKRSHRCKPVVRGLSKK